MTILISKCNPVVDLGLVQGVSHPMHAGMTLNRNEDGWKPKHLFLSVLTESQDNTFEQYKLNIHPNRDMKYIK